MNFLRSLLAGLFVAALAIAPAAIPARSDSIMAGNSCATARSDALTVVKDLGLTTGLKLALDAGDAISAPSSATKWLDISGNGYDFFRGTNATSQASDPTQNGTVGNRSSSEYWSFDGGDFFEYDTTNETWMENIHKDNAIFTIAGYYYPGATTGRITGTTGTGTGFVVTHTAGGALNLLVLNAGSAVRSLTGPALSLNVWHFIAVSLNEATGANGAVIQVDGTQTQFTSTYSSPAAGSAGAKLEIGAGSGASPLQSGSRIGQWWMWEGTALSGPQLRALNAATRCRWGS